MHIETTNGLQDIYIFINLNIGKEFNIIVAL